MSITTLEALAEVPVGQAIHVSNNRWNRTADGFERDGFTVPPGFFMGSVEEGLVQATMPIQVGQVYETGSTHRYVVRQSTDGAWWVARFRYTAYRSLERLTEIPGTLMDAPPDWLNTYVEVCTTAAEHAETAHTLALRVGELSAQGVVTRAQAQQALNDYLADHGGLTATESGDLIEVMENLGLDVPSQQIDVTVTVNGTSTVEVGSSTAEAYIGNVEVTDLGSAEVEWTRDFLIEDVQVNRNQCGCGTVDRDDVANLLSDADITYDTFSYEMECTND